MSQSVSDSFAGVVIVLSAFALYRGMVMLFRGCRYFRLKPDDVANSRFTSEADQIVFQWLSGIGHSALIKILRRNAVIQTMVFLILGFLLLLWAFALLDGNRSSGWMTDMGLWFTFLVIVTGTLAAVVVFKKQRRDSSLKESDQHIARRKEPVWFVAVLVITAIAVAVFVVFAMMSLILG